MAMQCNNKSYFDKNFKLLPLNGVLVKWTQSKNQEKHVGEKELGGGNKLSKGLQTPPWTYQVWAQTKVWMFWAKLG